MLHLSELKRLQLFEHNQFLDNGLYPNFYLMIVQTEGQRIKSPIGLYPKNTWICLCPL